MNRRIRYTGSLEKKVSKALGEGEKRRLDLSLLADPLQGSTIQGTGGAKKLRFPIKKQGKGKSGGLRVIHYFYDGKGVIYILDVYTKQEKSDITSEEKKAIKTFIARLKQPEPKGKKGGQGNG